MPDSIPLVGYLRLEPEPHLVASQCSFCSARYFDRRNACGCCGRNDFTPVAVATVGELTAFTIVAHAAPGIPVPFVAGIVQCDGTSVRGNLINIAPDPEHVRLGLKVRLATYVAGTDDNGTNAVGFGFEPLEA